MQTRTWWGFLGEVAFNATAIFRSSPSVPSEGPKSDELGVFEQSINAEISKLRGAQQVWRDKEVELLGSLDPVDAKSPSSPSSTSPAGVTVWQYIVDGLKEDIFEFIATPSKEMDVLMKKIMPKFEHHKDEVAELIKRLDSTVDPVAQKQLKVQICKINIHLIDAFIALINDVKAKIQSSITVNVISEEIGLSLLGATMFLLAQLTFPQVDLEQDTRNYMGKSIRENAKKLDGLLTRFEGELAQSWNHVAVDAPHAPTAADAAVVDAAADSAPSATDNAPVGASALGMFAAGGADVRLALRTSIDADATPAVEEARRFVA